MVEIFKPTGGIEKVECELAIIWNTFDIAPRGNQNNKSNNEHDFTNNKNYRRNREK